MVADFFRSLTRRLPYLVLALFVVLLDQISKYLAVKLLSPIQALPIVPGLNLFLGYNHGAAFSFLSDAGGWQRWFLVGVSAIISVALLVWIFKLADKRYWTGIALALILGGALANLWDRITLGYVIDFIQVYYQQWAWPTFNVGDSAICVGAAMLVIEFIRKPSKW
ncbi:MAG: signal peptidase II [Legionellales bacterium]|nr:signal peptidase II [Legionellales bacterium]|tara:strand:- start:8108 stop:8605 length:498 start_codon:yes stop_codon:yes gene_type:complete